MNQDKDAFKPRLVSKNATIIHYPLLGWKRVRGPFSHTCLGMPRWLEDRARRASIVPYGDPNLPNKPDIVVDVALTAGQIYALPMTFFVE